MPRDNRPQMIVLLGNTGTRYARTRHNAGWLLEEPLIAAADTTPGGSQQKFKAHWWQQAISGMSIVVLKPQTMMNLSGESVQAAARFFRLAPHEIAVAHDDVELGYGEIGVRLGGGLAGHNGLRSTAHCLGTPEFWRIRIGVGRPRHGELHGHVLGRFTSDEEAVLHDVMNAVVELIRRGYAEGFDALPNRVRVAGATGS